MLQGSVNTDIPTYQVLIQRGKNNLKRKQKCPHTELMLLKSK